MNPIAQELNHTISKDNGHIYEMLSQVGKNLFFPKGILSQSAEAREKAYRFNATIGMATEKGKSMYLPSIMSMVKGLTPDEALTYAPSFGIMPLRKAWQNAIFEKNPSARGKEISLPIVTHAITHALSVTADMWVDPGDAIILPDKMWGNYNLLFAVRKNASIMHYPLFDDRGNFHIKAFRTSVESQAREKGKVIVILNFPNNPTGYTPRKGEAEDIVGVLKTTAQKGANVIAICDDAYFGLFYEEGMLKESIFSRLAGVEPRLLSIKLDGFTKEDFVWGLRVGFVTYGAHLHGDSRPLYDALERKTAGAVRGSISNASRLGQQILLKAMNSNSYLSEKKEKFEILKARATEVKRVLGAAKYQDAWEVYPFNSGYFMCLRLKTVQAEALRIHLLDNYGIGVISLGEWDLRVAFSCIEKEDIQELFDTLLQGIKDLES